LADLDLRRIRLNHADFSRADLRGIDFQHASLSNAKFDGAKLDEGTSLWHANLSGAKFREAILTGVSLCEAQLLVTDFARSKLTDVDLRGAFATGTVFREADFTNVMIAETVLSRVNFSGARGLDLCVFSGPAIIDHETFIHSGPLPKKFLQGCGLPDNFIDYIPSLFSGDAIDFCSCFISYSHADKEFARKLHDTLQERGIRCWLDEKQLFPGDETYAQVDRGIRLWDKFLLCCSEAALTSWWVDSEIGTALEEEQRLTKERGKSVQKLISLNLDGYFLSENWGAGYRSQIRRRLAADFTGWEKDEAKFQAETERVINALRADDGAREKAPEGKL